MPSISAPKMVLAAFATLVSATGFTPITGLPTWADSNITISDQTLSRTPDGQPLHQVEAAVENFNAQQDVFDFTYTTAPCDEVEGICWSVIESTSDDYYAGLATFDATDWSGIGQMYYCKIDLNSTYGSSVHVIMHEMFHCFGYQGNGSKEDKWHSSDTDSIVSVVNHGGVRLSQSDVQFLHKVDPSA